MTGHQINSLVGDLVAMAQAMERLPICEADLAEARNNINAHLATIQRLELKLQDRSNEISDLQSRIRSLEVERDDAQFQALEADDRTQRALEFIKATFGNAGALIQALEPPRQEAPQPEHAASTMKADYEDIQHRPELSEGQSVDPLHTSGANTTESGHESDASSSITSNVGATPTSEPSPSAREVAAPQSPQSTDADGTVSTHQTVQSEHAASPGGAASTEPGGFSMKPIDRPYEGKTWSQWREANPHEVSPSRHEWEAGGGTLDNWYA